MNGVDRNPPPPTETPTPEPTSTPVSTDTPSAVAVGCSYFVLDVLNIAASATVGDTGRATFHVLTVTAGSVDVQCGDEVIRLGKFETAVVAGAAGTYQIRGVDSAAAVLRARVPER